MSGGEFHETRILVAALEGDGEEMQRLIAEMLPGERRHLIAACNAVAADAGLYCELCGEKIDPRGPFAPTMATAHPECVREATAKPSPVVGGPS